MFIIIIQARLGSTRLPSKIIKKLLDKEIFKWCYDRCCKSKADKVFIATSMNKENDLLEEFFKKYNIDYYRGSENDLLDRYYKLCKHFSLEKNNNLNIIRVTSDCPFIDYSIIDDMILFYKNNNYDYIINHSDEGITPEGSGIEIFNFKTLEYLWNNEKDINFREHATGMLRKTSIYNNIIKKGFYIYKPENINLEKMKFIKISIDTIDDYNNSLKIAQFFNNYDFSYYDILKYLENSI